MKKLNGSSHSSRWHHRGYLPHFEGGEIAQFITFRLADSLPRNILNCWIKELELEFISESEYHQRIDRYLDGAMGKCWLRNSDIAEMVKETLKHFDQAKYKLVSWVLMPNHAHLLLRPCKGFALSEIMHSIKSYTSHQANKILRRSGPFWSKEYFDRYIRDYEHFVKTIRYIENNPVKAGLVKSRKDWRYSSAFDEKK